MIANAAANAKELIMKKMIRHIVSAMIAVVLVVGAVVVPSIGQNTAKAAVDYNDATIQAYQDQIQKLEEQKQQYLASLSGVQDDLTKAKEYKEYLDNLVNSTTTKISLAEQLLASIEANISETEQLIADEEAKLQELFDNFCERIRLNYEDGNVSYIGLLLGADSLTDFLTRIDRVNSMLSYDASLKKDYQQRKAELEDTYAKLQASREQQEATIEQLKNDQLEYDKLIVESQAYFEQLQSNEEAYRQFYQATKAEEEAARKELDDYIAWLEEQSKQEEYQGGGFIWPAPSDMHGITSKFGWRILLGQWDYHLGIDIWGYGCYGKDIYASAAGTVIFSAYSGSYGNCVIIDHGSGITTLYAHCSELLASPGQYVQQGEVIGKVGVSGFVTGAHIHFEYRINGERMDPEQYIQLPSDLMYY